MSIFVYQNNNFFDFMYCFISQSKQAAFNLATEEYLLKNYAEDFFFLYRNNPALIVGKHQNTLAEINHEKTSNENIPVLRRLSGGGTVYHDEGNLNYCFIKKGEKGKLVNFKKYASPILATLQKLNVNAKFEGKSDLCIDGKKFSGNASHVYKNKVMQHGTMLFSSNLMQLHQFLKVNPLKYTDRGVRSIRSRVTNITEHLTTPINIEQFANLIISEVKLKFPNVQEFKMSESDKNKIELLMQEKYTDWEWNYAYSPNYTFAKVSNLPNGSILEVNLKVEKGVIKKLKFKGNCLSDKTISVLEKNLCNITHTKESVYQKIDSINLHEYFNTITSADFVSSLF